MSQEASPHGCGLAVSAVATSAPCRGGPLREQPSRTCPQCHSSPSPAQASRELSRLVLLDTPSHQCTLLNFSRVQLLLPSFCLSPGPLSLLSQLSQQPSRLSPCLQFYSLQIHLPLGYHRGCMTFQNGQSEGPTITSRAPL